MQVSNVSAPVMEVVLEFIYTNLMPALPEAFLIEEGAEELFYAADRYLIFPMKVCASKIPTSSTSPAQHETLRRRMWRVCLCVAQGQQSGSSAVHTGDLESRAVRFRRIRGHAYRFCRKMPLRMGIRHVPATGSCSPCERLTPSCRGGWQSAS